MADSEGFERNKSFYGTTYDSIKDFIEFQIKTRDPDRYIHCIWYCWTGSRLEEYEIEILKQLNEQYSFPIIIVYTNSIEKEQIYKAKEYIANKLKLKNEFIDEFIFQF